MELLKDKNVVITGCNRGIGLAILNKCAEYEAANIFAVVRKKYDDFSAYLGELSEKTGIRIREIYADFSDDDAVKQAAKEILSEKLPIHALVNNIGVAFPQSSLAMTKMEHIKNTFDINLFSPMLFTQQLARNMMKNRTGSIVFISSSAAYDGGANIEYSASKAAIIGEVKRLAVEYGAFGLRVNAVAPGLTDTDMGVMSPEDEAVALSMNIMHRKGKPGEIADAVAFLASDMSAFITGQVLRVDGGLR